MKHSFYQVISGQRKGIFIDILKVFLWLFSGIYFCLLNLRRFLFAIGLMPTAKLEKPVISVGNLTAGGAGKTPFVVYLTDYLRGRGIKCAILTRGYMPQGSKEHSDEAQWLKETLQDIPVLVGKRRADEAKKFLTQHTCDVFVLDDGFQHLSLKRDLDVVLIDASNPWGGGNLLPRGLLREPASALKRADIAVLTKVDQVLEKVQSVEDKIRAINPAILLLHAIHQSVDLINIKTKQLMPVSFLSHKRIISFSSIAAPVSFQHSLKEMKAETLRHFSFADHHSYLENDLQEILKACRQGGVHVLVTTEKDAVKLEKFLYLFNEQVEIWALRIKINIVKGKDELFKRISHLL